MRTPSPSIRPSIQEIPFRLRGNYQFKKKVFPNNQPFLLEAHEGGEGEIPSPEIIKAAADYMNVDVQIINHVTNPRSSVEPGKEMLILGIPKTFKKKSRDELLVQMYDLMVNTTNP